MSSLTGPLDTELLELYGEFFFALPHTPQLSCQTKPPNPQPLQPQRNFFFLLFSFLSSMQTYTSHGHPTNIQDRSTGSWQKYINKFYSRRAISYFIVTDPHPVPRIDNRVTKIYTQDLLANCSVFSLGANEWNAQADMCTYLWGRNRFKLGICYDAVEKVTTQVI